jgi:hypothetical protein
MVEGCWKGGIRISRKISRCFHPRWSFSTPCQAFGGTTKAPVNPFAPRAVTGSVFSARLGRVVWLSIGIQWGFNQLVFFLRRDSGVAIGGYTYSRLTRTQLIWEKFGWTKRFLKHLETLTHEGVWMILFALHGCFAMFPSMLQLKKSCSGCRWSLDTLSDSVRFLFMSSDRPTR